MLDYCLEICVSAVERGVMHVDCVNKNNDTLLYVLCRHPPSKRELVLRLCARGPDLAKFWCNFSRRIEFCSLKAVQERLPYAMWVDFLKFEKRWGTRRTTWFAVLVVDLGTTTS